MTVTWYGLAEFGFYDACGWQLPKNHLDLFTWYMWFKNGKKMRIHGNILLAAAMNFNITTMSTENKDHWRDLIINRAWSKDQIPGILRYNEDDISLTTALLYRFVRYIDLRQELLRGDYIKVLSLVELRGIPIDCKSLNAIKAAWPELKKLLIAEVNKIHPFFKKESFNFKEFQNFLTKNQI